jgi:hypothetical protein
MIFAVLKTGTKEMHCTIAFSKFLTEYKKPKSEFVTSVNAKEVP